MNLFIFFNTLFKLNKKFLNFKNLFFRNTFTLLKKKEIFLFNFIFFKKIKFSILVLNNFFFNKINFFFNKINFFYILYCFKNNNILNNIFFFYKKKKILLFVINKYLDYKSIKLLSILNIRFIIFNINLYNLNFMLYKNIISAIVAQW